ncbi:hypothetical protein E2C01_084315 [Portunus trituberculatus]|uniref:Uncharacterized protein n=1 Tax=Portunus trituberculatus TaxID=210409 RepID=A0A5B7J4H5_PORTR|nr:hypothetical protein [Portunus trituberculatus]
MSDGAANHSALPFTPNTRPSCCLAEPAMEVSGRTYPPALTLTFMKAESTTACPPDLLHYGAPPTSCCRWRSNPSPSSLPTRRLDTT